MDYIVKNKQITFLLFFLIFTNYFLTFEIRYKTLIYLVIFLYSFFFNKSSISKFNLNVKLSYLLLFLITLVFQNHLLNFEIISIDVPSYLVASQSVSLSTLPYEIQWESKGPLFMYLYKLVLLLSGSSYIYFRLANDILLFLIAVLIFKIIEIKSKNNLQAFLGSVLFLLLTSYEWYLSEYSEIYCLIFLILQYFIIQKFGYRDWTIVVSGILFSFSTLINQGTAIFIVLFSIVLALESKTRAIVKVAILSSSFLLPHFVMFLIYFFNNLQSIYFTNYISIPLNYVGSGNFKFYELIVWLRRYFFYSENLYYLILIIPFLVIFSSRKIISKKEIIFDLSYLLSSFLIYFIAGHNYQHHLFYLIAFGCVFTSYIKLNTKTIMYPLLVVIVSIQLLISLSPLSYNNLKSIDSTYNNYPLLQLSKEIDDQFNDREYTVLAVDSVLVLFYLNKVNNTYIVHPFNHYEEYIVSALLRTGNLKSNELSHLSYAVDLNPDVIICVPTQIVAGSPNSSEIFNCEVTDYKKDYYRLDTNPYTENMNGQYYYDPYSKVQVYLKNNQ